MFTIVKKLLISLFLALIACGLTTILLPLGFIYEIGFSIFNFKLRGSLEYITKTLFKIAISLDQLGNVFCKSLFNDFLITKEGHKFGDEDEVISSVLGRNNKLGTLTKVGKVLDFILNVFEKDHSIKSIEDKFI